jgi:EAL domain-containing protein (putative c-di-GMP-specific phosphodiesterase class I)
MNAPAHLIETPRDALLALDGITNDDTADIAFQPIRPLQAPAGPDWYEVLLRPKHCDAHTVVVTAEALHRAPLLDAIVARAAARAMTPGVVYSLNVSGQSVSDPGFPDRFWRALEPARVTPQSLVIEVTETARITNIGAAHRFCESVRDAGACIAIDDVAGADLPLPLEWVDVLKVDGRRLGGLTSRRSGVIIAALMRLANASDGRLRVVAEGVETADELNSIALAGVHYWQGHYRQGHATMTPPTCQN